MRERSDVALEVQEVMRRPFVSLGGEGRGGGTPLPPLSSGGPWGMTGTNERL